MTDALLLAAIVGASPPVTSDGTWGRQMPVSAPASSQDTGRGRFIEGTYRGAAGERRYKLYLPDAARDASGGGGGLVVVLHGCTQDADDLARGTGLNAAAEAHGWSVLYPEQPASAHPNQCWNWYDPAHQRRDLGEPSLIAGLTAAMVRAHDIPPDRVWLAGISAGGAMASIVAAAYPEMYSALALHSALVHTAATSVGEALGVMQRGVAAVEPHAQAAFEAMGSRGRVIPTLVIHGEADRVVAPLNGAQAARQWFLTNALVLGQPLDTTSGGVDHAESVEGGYRVRSAVYRARSGEALSYLVMVRELGHAWSGGSAGGSFADPKGPRATARILEFFARTGNR